MSDRGSYDRGDPGIMGHGAYWVTVFFFNVVFFSFLA